MMAILLSAGFVSFTDRAVHPIRARVVDTDGNVSDIAFNLFPDTLQSLTKISGDNQPPGTPNAPLPVPLVVELRNVNDGSPLEGIWVTFAVIAGGGRVSQTGVLTNVHGRAETVFTLGPFRGTNTVEVSALGFTTTFNAVAGSHVNVPDPLLRAVIEKTLNKVSGEPISQADMATLTYTEPKSWSIGISDLTGIEFAINLTHLDLSDNSISDISSLANLTKLTHLSLRGNSVSDISPLAGLTNLEWLVLNNNTISDISDVGGLISLTVLALGNNAISDISPLAELTNLKWVYLEDNNIKDISPLTGLMHLQAVQLANNNISDLSPLAENQALGDGTQVDVRKNPLSYPSIQAHIPSLQKYGVEIDFEDRNSTSLEPISGAEQEDLPGKVLANPLVVEVKDESGSAFEGVPVTFAVTAGGGTLTARSTTTDLNGRAESILTLGENPGTNTVRVSVEGISQPATFNAEGIRVPRELAKISGEDQEGFPGKTLPNPLVVEVRDQFDKPLRNVRGTFTVTTGGGTLTVTTTKTDRRGRAQSKLTLGPAAGMNSVSVSVSGIEQVVIFNIEGVRTPQKILKISGDNQEGLTGETLASPLVVEIRDRHDTPLSEAQVAFTVTVGGGTLTVTTTTTDTSGRAESVLTLGPNAGTHTISVSASGIEQSELFNAEGIRTPQKIVKISGDGQEGLPGAGLANAFVVEVQDENGATLEGVPVAFAVTAGGGTLDTQNIATDANGRAESKFMLGQDPRTNSIRVVVEGISQPVTFNAEGIRVPQELSKLSGDDQEGFPGETLPNPFVVQVRDHFDKPLEHVTVTFTVSVGAGTLTVTSSMTDTNGRAESELTLGSNAGTNSVSASASGIEKSVVFTSEGIRTPQSILKISGDSQEGIPNTKLPDPFIIEVQDKTGSSLEGVPVTFAVTNGGGTLSVTSMETAPDGRAESILTFAASPEIHTVEVSAKGVDATVIFRVDVKRREFILSVPSGSSLIHIPLKVTEVDGKTGTIESVGDLYDALGGTDTVNLLTTRDFRTQQWHSYLGHSSRGTLADPLLTDDRGIIASMKMPVELHLAGDALGKNRASTIWLQPGTNLVGVPLRDSRITRVSGLLALEGIRDNVPAITVLVNGNFKVVAQAGDDGDIPITGGQSFIMAAQSEAAVVVTGDGWGGFSGTEAAPPLAPTSINVRYTTPVLCLTGSIVYEAGSREWGLPLAGVSLSVTVKDLITGKTVTTLATKGDSSRSKGVSYQLTLVEAASGRAARAGDILEIFVQSFDSLIRVEPLRYTVTPTDVKNNRIELSKLIAYAIPTQTQLLLNYPNPFNPETWISYQLAKDANVTLTIYDARGALVRRLEIGHQSAGYYTSRGKAAYWDGRNEIGELVASGLYFYQLGTPSFRQLRRMVNVK